MPLGLKPGREQRRNVLFIMQSLVSRAGMSSPERGFDVQPVKERGLLEHVISMDQQMVLTREQAEVKLRMSEAPWLEEQLGVAEEDSKTIFVARALVDKVS